MNDMDKNNEIYCPNCGKPVKMNKVRMLLIYPIYFLAGMGINLIIIWLISIITWINDEFLDFNLVLKNWNSLIWFIIGAIFWSLFVGLWHEHMST